MFVFILRKTLRCWTLIEDGLKVTPNAKGRARRWLTHPLGLTHTLFHVLNVRFSWYHNK